MAKSQLEKAISQAANDFALQIIEAVKASTLEELLALQNAEAPKKRGRKPGRPPKSATATPKKRGRKPGRPPKSETEEEAAPKKRGRKPGRPAKNGKAKVVKKAVTQKAKRRTSPSAPTESAPTTAS